MRWGTDVARTNSMHNPQMRADFDSKKGRCKPSFFIEAYKALQDRLRLFRGRCVTDRDPFGT